MAKQALKNPTKFQPTTYNNSTNFHNQANPSQTTKITELTKSQLFQNGSNSIPERRARRDESNGTNLAIKNLLELSESANQNLVKPGQSQRVDQVNPSSPNDLIFQHAQNRPNYISMDSSQQEEPACTSFLP